MAEEASYYRPLKVLREAGLVDRPMYGRFALKCPSPSWPAGSGSMRRPWILPHATQGRVYIRKRNGNS